MLEKIREESRYPHSENELLCLSSILYSVVLSFFSSVVLSFFSSVVLFFFSILLL